VCTVWCKNQSSVIEGWCLNQHLPQQCKTSLMLEQPIFFQPLHERTLRLRTSNRLLIGLDSRPSPCRFQAITMTKKIGPPLKRVLRNEAVKIDSKSVSQQHVSVVQNLCSMVTAPPPSRDYIDRRLSQWHLRYSSNTYV
jgi:hypothetical protein